MSESPPVYTIRPATRPQTVYAKPDMMTREELEKLERQLIPTLNSVRAALGKPPIIVPKG